MRILVLFVVMILAGAMYMLMKAFNAPWYVGLVGVLCGYFLRTLSEIE